MKSVKGSFFGLVVAGILALAPTAALAHGGGGGGFGGGGGHSGGGGHFGGGGAHFGGGGGHFGGGHVGGGHVGGFAGRSFAGHSFAGHGFAERGGAHFARHEDHFRHGDHFRREGDFFLGNPFFYDYPYAYDYPYYSYYDDNAGDYSGVIIAVQKELTQLGYYHGPVDGVIGPEMDGAIRWFQSVDKLPVTGQIDDRTLQALGIS